MSELVAMHIGQNMHKSATMLVDSGASHILVRQEHAHVLTNFTMSPNGHAFASLKSAKKCERYEHEIDYRLGDIGSSKSL